MKRTYLQNSTTCPDFSGKTDKPQVNRGEFHMSATKICHADPSEISFNESLYDPKDNHRVKHFVRIQKYSFILFFCIFFLVACNNQKRSKEASNNDDVEQLQVADIDTSEEVEGAIDDSGEVVQDTTEEIEIE